MKKVFLLTATIFGFLCMNAQDATEKGSWVIEANTGSWATGNTSFGLTSTESLTNWSIGADAGYFVADNLAVKLGLGYTDGDSYSEGIFTYKLGGQYYINGKIPVGLDFTGHTAGDGNQWIGFEGGYAWFVAENVSVTPKVRYNLTLDEDKGESAFQGLIGFSIFL